MGWGQGRTCGTLRRGQVREHHGGRTALSESKDSYAGSHLWFSPGGTRPGVVHSERNERGRNDKT